MPSKPLATDTLREKLEALRDYYDFSGKNEWHAAKRSCITEILGWPEIAAAPQPSQQEATEAVAQWMLARSYATGHGDTVEDLLGELEAQAGERVAARAAGRTE